jgi:tetratricopeptide (TPR) repeat protein
VQLVKVADGFYLWSRTYDRTMDDIFAVQDDIARSVVTELRAMLTDKEADTLTDSAVISEVAEAVRGRADDPEAHRLMLLGRYFLDRTTREDTGKAIDYFRQALDIDPEFALCWAELGRAFSVEAGRGWIAVADGFARAREAIGKALALEPDLAEAHAQLGRVQLTHDWDMQGAEASYRRALELAPGSSTVLDGASVLAYKLGRFDEALELGRKVLMQDPLSAAFWHNLGLTAHAAGRLDESEEAFGRALELVPQRFVSRALLALVLMDQGRVDEAYAEAQNEPEEFWRLWARSILDSLSGKAAEASRELERLVADFAEGNSYQIAEVYAVRGETERAFEWLERAYAERDAGITHAKANPRFRRVHDDPRWPALLKKIGFEA